MKHLTVLLTFGGESSEHDVSVSSAKNVYAAIDKKKHNVQLAYIDRDGRWWFLDEWTDTPDEARTTQLVAAPGTGYFLTVPGSETLAVDVLYPVLHGKLGEDGTIQGLAEMMHIPIVGPGVEASAVCMNKDATKRLLEAHDIPVVPWVKVMLGDNEKSTLKAVKRLSKDGPWFVKPSRAGSSIGVSKVTDTAKLWGAVTKALKHDSMVLIESAVNGRELEVGVLGNPPEHKATRIGEILPSHDFYDYDAKYAETSTSKTIVNTKLPNAVAKTIRSHALDAFQLLGCQGMARVDFLLSDDLTPYVNEINTLPGFTNISMYPKMWEDKGVSYSELIDTLIELAIKK